MSLQKEYETYLAHHGVKGMKWGIRKAIKGAGKTIGKVAKPGVKFIGRSIRDVLPYIGRTFKAGGRALREIGKTGEAASFSEISKKKIKKSYNNIKNKSINNYKHLKQDYKDLFA